MEFSRRRLLETGGATLAYSLLAPALAQQADVPPAPKAKPDPYADGVLVAGEPPLPIPGAFTFAVLPDTQFYAEKFPETFTAQTHWIAANRQQRRIAGVFHLGDITNNNTAQEWENAQASMRVLTAANIPSCMVPGNHDYGPGGKGSDRTTRLNEYFSIADLRRRKEWGGSYDREPDRLENTYQLLEAEGRKFLILGLEFGPRADVVRWATEVAGAHRGHEIVLLTHAFVYHDNTRYDWRQFGSLQSANPYSYKMAKTSGQDVSDGEDLWRNLVSRHGNFILTINGHVGPDGLGRLTSPAADGRAIPQTLVNFQFRPQGGDGWLRLIEMRPDGTAQTYDYSPTRGQRNESDQNQFLLKLPPIHG